MAHRFGIAPFEFKVIEQTPAGTVRSHNCKARATPPNPAPPLTQ